MIVADMDNLTQSTNITDKATGYILYSVYLFYSYWRSGWERI
jgi:hypothetical protein